MNLKQKLIELLAEGKSHEEILSWIGENAKDFQGEDVKTVFTEALAAHEATKGAKAALSEKAKADADAAHKHAVSEEAKAMATEILKGLPAPANGLEHDGSVAAGDGVTKDWSWKKSDRALIKALYDGDKQKVKEISAMHASRYKEKAILVGDSSGVVEALVTEEWDTEVHRLATAQFTVLQDIRPMPIRTDTFNINSITDVTLDWLTAQGDTITETNPVVSEKVLVLKDLAGRTRIGNSFMEDEQFDIMGLLTERFAEARGRKLSREILAADSSVTGEEFDGIFFTTGIGSRAAEVGVLKIEDAAGTIKAVSERMLASSKFYMNHATLLDWEEIKDTTGRPVVKTDQGSGRERFLKGFPIRIVEDLPNTFDGTTASTGSDKSTMIFGDLSRLRVVTKGGMRIALSPHEEFSKNLTVFRVIERMAWGVPDELVTTFSRLHTFKLTI